MKYVLISLVLIAFIFGGIFWSKSQKATTEVKDSEYNPQINPADFSTNITNPYFSLPVGKRFEYKGDAEEGLERIEIVIEEGTKNIMGVETVIYRDKVYIDEELVEDTRDYLAQDQEGNVWYFGEEVDNFENGQLKDHAGSFIAGVDGALPGIWIKGQHTVGDSYRQEFYLGEAEDMRDVVAVNQTVKTNEATYNDCVKFYDWTPLDSESREHKYYCPEIGGLVLIEDLTTSERSELVEVTSP